MTGNEVLGRRVGPADNGPPTEPPSLWFANIRFADIGLIFIAI